MQAHRGNNVRIRELHAAISLQILIRATQKPGNEPRLLALLETVHQPHRLPIEIRRTLRGEQRVDAGVVQRLRRGLLRLLREFVRFLAGGFLQEEQVLGFREWGTAVALVVEH